MSADQTISGRKPPASPIGAMAGRLARLGVMRSWLVTRALALLLLAFEYPPVTGDLRYYYNSTGQVIEGTAALSEVMVEYPPICVLLAVCLRVLAGVQQDVYSVSFMLLMLGVDALFTRAIWRAERAGTARSTAGTPGNPGFGPGLSLWLWFAPALGPLLYARLDLLPGALAGAAVMALLGGAGGRFGGPGVRAGVLAGLGSLVKVFPLIVLPALWLRRGQRWQLTAAFAATLLGGLGLTSVFTGGERLWSPLGWQQDRGLQIESVAALPLLVAAVFRPGSWRTEYSDHLAIEIFGPGVATLLTAATVAAGLAFAVLAFLWFRGLRVRAPSVPAAAWLVVATVCLVLLTNKVFSPQYMVWLAAVLAALGVVVDEPAVWRVGRLFLLACVLTQGFYPTLYRFLIDLHPAMVTLILLRDLVLLVLTWLAVRAYWACTRA